MQQQHVWEVLLAAGLIGGHEPAVSMPLQAIVDVYGVR